MNNAFCYIHIPFCTSKCIYCRFASFGGLEQLKVDIYIKYLIKEIQNNKIDFNNLKSIYFGGGTPSVLNLKQLKIIIDTLKNKYNFDDNMEINLEATPKTITKQNLAGWKKIGINRISVGVQTLNSNSLIEIGREEKGDILKALDNIYKVGFYNISIDFIIGLPYVVKGEIKTDIEYILDKYDFVKHISVYMLEDYYYPGKWSSISIKEEEYLKEYIEVKNFLKQKLFNSYEISNFSKAGYECKHNQAYWNHSNILAFGLGAHGFIDGVRFNNSEKFNEYYSGKQIIEDKLTKADILIEKVMFNLRTNGLTKEIYKNINIKKINNLITKGLLCEENTKIVLTNRGVLLLDYILKEII